MTTAASVAPPTVSVAIKSYNHADYVHESIAAHVIPVLTYYQLLT